MGFHPNKLKISENLFSLIQFFFPKSRVFVKSNPSSKLFLPGLTAPARLVGLSSNTALPTGLLAQSCRSSEPLPTVLMSRCCNINNNCTFKSSHLDHFLECLKLAVKALFNLDSPSALTFQSFSPCLLHSSSVLFASPKLASFFACVFALYFQITVLQKPSPHVYAIHPLRFSSSAIAGNKKVGYPWLFNSEGSTSSFEYT